MGGGSAGLGAGAPQPSTGASFDPEDGGPGQPPGPPEKTEWGRFSYVANGTAGDWVAIYQAFKEPVNEINATIKLSVDIPAPTQGTAGFLFVPPALMWHCEGQQPGLTFADFRFRLLDAGEDYREEASVDRSSSISGCQYSGYFFALASTAPWALSVDLSLGAGNQTTSPYFLAQGSGATLFEGTFDSAAGTQAVGTARLDAVLPGPGWAHFHVRRTSIQPDGARSYALDFPDGTSFNGVRYEYGDTVTGSSRSGIDFAGVPWEQPGEFHAEISVAEANEAFRTALLFFPFDPLGLGAAEFGSYVGLE